MKLTDVERGVRRLSWPEPPAELRARVLADASAVPGTGAWRARVTPEAAAPATGEFVALSARRWGRATGLMALAALIIVGSCTGLDMWAGSQVNAEIARLEGRYGSLALSTLTVPAVPAEDNRALVVKAAAELTVGRPLYERMGFSSSVPVRQEMREFAEANQVPVRIAAGVRSRRQSNWQVDYARGQRFPDDTPIRMLADAISVTALLELEAGLADEALATIATGLGVTASLRQEPELVAQLIRTNDLGRQQLLTIREIVTRSEPSAHALDDVAWWLSENRAPDPGLVATLGTLKQAHAIFTRMANGDIDSDLAVQIYPSAWPAVPPQYLGLATRLGRPFVRRAQSRFLKEMSEVLAVLTAPPPRRQVPWYLYLDRGPVEQMMHPLTEKFTDDKNWSAWNGYNFLSSLAATEVAVALRRFRINNGGYPDDLADLVPLYLDRLPIDPSTGLPPVYARQGAGFTLRAKGSVGAADFSALEWSVSK